MKYIIMLLLTMLLAGCLDEDGGTSSSEVQAIVDKAVNPLKAEIDSLKAENAKLSNQIQTVLNNRARVGDRFSFKAPEQQVSWLDEAIGFMTGQSYAVPPPNESVGTVLQYSSSRAGQADGVSARMDTGYAADWKFVRVSGGFQSHLAETPFPVYESSDCGVSGDDLPFLEAERVGVQAQKQGLVVRLPDQETIESRLSDADNYWRFDADAVVETIQAKSRLGGEVQGQRDCQLLQEGGGEAIAVPMEVIRLIPNDPTITSIPNEPWDDVPVWSGG